MTGLGHNFGHRLVETAMILWLRRRSWAPCAGPARKLKPVAKKLEQICRWGAEEALCSGGTVGAVGYVVVQDGQDPQLPVGQQVQMVLA